MLGLCLVFEFWSRVGLGSTRLSGSEFTCLLHKKSVECDFQISGLAVLG